MERINREMPTRYTKTVRRKLCFLFGHVIEDIDFKDMTARCAWCGAALEVSYDMYAGETIILGAIEK